MSERHSKENDATPWFPTRVITQRRMSESTPARDNPILKRRVDTVLLSMSAPISIGMLSTFLFQVVDTFFVGQLGSRELAALGFAATTYFLAVALFMGMAVGVSALVGGALGAGNRALARRYATVSSSVAIGISVAVAGVGIVSLHPLFTALGASPELIPLIDEYMTVLYAGMPVCILYLLVTRGLLTLASGELRAELKQIARLSSPAIATQLLLPATAMLITYLAAKSGPEAVAAFGVAQRIETLALVGISSVTIAIVPFVAQNDGAGQPARVDQAIAFSGKASLYWGAGVCLLLVAFAGPIAGLFSDDGTITQYTKLDDFG